jgi:hypothetical protein
MKAIENLSPSVENWIRSYNRGIDFGHKLEVVWTNKDETWALIKARGHTYFGGIGCQRPYAPTKYFAAEIDPAKGSYFSGNKHFEHEGRLSFKAFESIIQKIEKLNSKKWENLNK